MRLVEQCECARSNAWRRLRIGLCGVLLKGRFLPGFYDLNVTQIYDRRAYRDARRATQDRYIAQAPFHPTLLILRPDLSFFGRSWEMVD